MDNTVHYIVSYGCYKFRTHSVTLRLCFCCLNDNYSMVLKLEVFNLESDVLSRITQGMDLYISAKFRAFNTNLNNVAPFFCTKRKANQIKKNDQKA